MNIREQVIETMKKAVLSPGNSDEYYSMLADRLIASGIVRDDENPVVSNPELFEEVKNLCWDTRGMSEAQAIETAGAVISWYLERANK
jgi:hypothetical protein